MSGRDTLEAAIRLLIRNTKTPLDLEGALTVAECFHQQNEPLIVSGIKITLRQLVAGYSPSRPAGSVCITFYGGPVGEGKWYKGTVWSLIVDIVASNLQTQGYQKTLRMLKLAC